MGSFGFRKGSVSTFEHYPLAYTTGGYLYCTNITHSIFFSIIEVDSWKVKSTVELAKACKEVTTKSKKACYVIAIDTMLGSSEHYETAESTYEYATE
jgi:hypothetical protein